MSPPRVIVVGGGITGLTVGCTLLDEARRLEYELDVTVLEAAGEAGGHARTLEENGFLVEAGPNGFLDREPATRELVDALGLGHRLLEARPESKRRYIVRGGRLRKVPDSPLALLTSGALSPAGTLRLLCEPFAPGPPSGVDETVFDFAARRIGREAAELLVDAAVSGISAGDSRQLSVRAQFPLMVEMERDHGGLIKAMIARRRAGISAPRLFSFDRGLATLTRALVDRLGRRLRLRTAVTAIERDGVAWRVRDRAGSTWVGDHVVLANAARAAAGPLQGLDQELSLRLAAIPYSGVNLVALAYREQDLERPLDGYGYLVTRPEGLSTLGVVWESSLFPGRVPEGHALLRVFLGGARRPEAVDLAPGAAVELARRELRSVLGLQAAPTNSWVFRWPAAIAQYTLGHTERVERIRERLTHHQGLHVCGTSYDGVSFNHAIASGQRLARTLAALRPGTHPVGCSDLSPLAPQVSP